MSRELGVSDARVRTLRTLLGDAVPGLRIGLKKKVTKKTKAYRKGRPKQL